MPQRRDFIKQASLLSLASVFMPMVQTIAAEHGAVKPKLLVRSGWQTVNIGDIGHTFGLLALLEQHLPDVDLVLWPKVFDRGVEQLIRNTFPKVKIVKSRVEEISPELKSAYEECTFMIHSSGPFVIAQKELRSWWDVTKKPFGIYGVSLDEVSPDLIAFVNNASFFYCRDTESLRYLKTLNVKSPIQQFAPDAVFGIKIYNDQKAQSYLDSVGLKKDEFICVIPRLRYTPYAQMNNKEPTESERQKGTVAAVYKDIDALKMRNVITAWVKATNLKVLICPEVTYQVELGKETLYDPLPDHVKKNVVWRDTFWLPDEATSVYKQARAMVCCEPHSLIMALANGIPSIHVKQPTDTRKGQMFRDIGLNDWYFLMDETPSSQITAELLKIHNNYPQALKQVTKAMDYVKNVQKQTMQAVRKAIPAK
jgi:polysaccharide pyruvyl transferase WcaK-like protein